MLTFNNFLAVLIFHSALFVTFSASRTWPVGSLFAGILMPIIYPVSLKRVFGQFIFFAVIGSSSSNSTPKIWFKAIILVSLSGLMRFKINALQFHLKSSRFPSVLNLVKSCLFFTASQYRVPTSRNGTNVQNSKRKAPKMLTIYFSFTIWLTCFNKNNVGLV